MNNRPIYWFPLGILAVIAGLTFWLQFVVQSPRANVFSKDRHIADYIIEQFSVSRTNLAGQLIYTLHADHAEHFLDDDTTALLKPHLVAHDDHQGSADVRAKRGFVTAKGKEAHFMGNVVLVRDAHDGQGPLTLTTEYLVAIPDARVVRTNKLVHVVGKSIQMTAGGLELNNQTRVLRLTNKVKARYEPIK